MRIIFSCDIYQNLLFSLISVIDVKWLFLDEPRLCIQIYAYPRKRNFKAVENEYKKNIHTTLHDIEYDIEYSFLRMPK